MPTSSTALVPQIDPELRAQLVQAAASGVDLSELFERFAAGLVPHEQVVPRPVEVQKITEAEIKALTKAARAVRPLFGKVAPTERRELTDAELADLLAEREAIDALLKAAKKLKDRKDEGIKHTVANHLDRQAERLGEARPEATDDLPATERDKHGHYLVGNEVRVPGTDKKFRRELAGGKPVLDGELLLAAKEAGHITHDQYLAVTTPVRVPNAEKAREAVAKAPELLALLAKHATTTTAQTGAIWVRSV